MATRNPDDEDRIWRQKAEEAIIISCRRRYPEHEKLPERPWFIRNKLVSEQAKQILLQLMHEARRSIEQFAARTADFMIERKGNAFDRKCRRACVLNEVISASTMLKERNLKGPQVTKLRIAVEMSRGRQSEANFDIRVGQTNTNVRPGETAEASVQFTDTLEIIVRNGETAVEAAQIKIEPIIEKSNCWDVINKDVYEQQFNHPLHDGELKITVNFEFAVNDKEYILKREVVKGDREAQKLQVEEDVYRSEIDQVLVALGLERDTEEYVSIKPALEPPNRGCDGCSLL